MRFWSAALALFAALAAAQQQNAINVPAGQSTLDVVAGQPITITWENPSSGTVTIKLQQAIGQITPQSGIVVASNIAASDQTATFTIQPGQVNSFQYTIEIIDDSNASNYNFSPSFGIQGATGTSTGSASASATGTSSSGSFSASASASGTSTNESSSTMTGSSSSGSRTATSTSRMSSTGTSSAATETTSAPSAGGAAGLTVPAGFLALVAGAAALL